MQDYKGKSPALIKIISIIDCLVESGALTAHEIMKKTDLPRSSLYFLLNEMKEQRLLNQNANNQYVLGLKLFEWGACVSIPQRMKEVAYEPLSKLSHETNMLCHLGILENNNPIYVMRIDSDSHIQVKTWEGKKLSIYRSSLGKCLLAFQPEDIKKEILKSITFEKHLKNSISNLDELKKELIKIKKCGWAKDDEEDSENIRCVSAPIFSIDNKIIAAISLVGTTIDIEDKLTFDDASKKIINTANIISKRLRSM